MEKLWRRRSQQKDVPVELIQHIQSLLPLKEAACTCVLSKTWSHAWSTIPHLRFHKTSKFLNEEKDRDYMKLIDRTMFRYVQDNIPIESFDLKLDFNAASLANKWIRTVASQSCLKELSLEIWIVKGNNRFMLLDDIFSGINLLTMSVRVRRCSFSSNDIVSMSLNPVIINCESLRVLELEHVKISEEVLDSLFSTCTLLEKIDLAYCRGFTTIKVNNLRYLKELKLSLNLLERYQFLNIDGVPNLPLFFYHLAFRTPITFNMTSLMGVTELSLHGVIINVAFVDMIKSKLPFLEILYIENPSWTSERLDFTSSSLKRLALIIRRENRRVDIQVCAPKLYHLSYSGDTIPSVLFQSSKALEYMKLSLDLWDHVDLSFFLRMRELFNLSSNF
ncbi:putative F-box/LRR-repeat protein At3g58880 [Rutidosis leptorrhynchoides]|uniref:putative F-box/LRR-repeat protein At3g58880 n=1 Tax=Rutidosis leptorrhynchoides TaxID=125765 RepID=UPI003A9A5A4E